MTRAIFAVAIAMAAPFQAPAPPQPAAPAAPNPEIYDQLGPDSFPHDGLPRRDLRAPSRPFTRPPQQLPDLSHVPAVTVWSLLLMAAPVAGIVEEAAFRGYMQGPLERRFGLSVAILVTGTMFAVAHLDSTPILWPYYVAVAAI